VIRVLTFCVRAGRAGPARALLLAGTLAALLGACSSSDPEYVERPVEELYNTAMDSLLAGEYQESARLFDEVERQHPYSVWASKAQLMAAFANYQDNKYDDAINALDRFIQLHPGNRDIAYAYYLRAISYYEQISDVGRDQKMTRMALESLEELIRRFPDSRYTRDAQLKVDLARDHLAGKHMEIGRYYQDQGEYLDQVLPRHILAKLRKLIEAPGPAASPVAVAAIAGIHDVLPAADRRSEPAAGVTPDSKPSSLRPSSSKPCTSSWPMVPPVLP